MAEEDKKDPVKIVNDAEKLALKSMEPQIRVWRDGINAYHNRGPITDPMKVNIKIGSLMADAETVVPRDAKALLGSRPYMPLRAADTKNVESIQRAEKMNKLLDRYADRGFFMAFTDGLRLTRTHGISYFEPRWGFLPKSISQREMERDRFNRVVGFADSVVGGVNESLEWKGHDPWAVRPHPHGNTLKSKSEIVIAELVATSEIERLLDSKDHPYKLPPDKKAKDLQVSEPTEDDDALIRLKQDKSFVSGEQKSSIGILLRYYANPTREYPNGRWIHTWNRTLLLLDEENMSSYMPADQKPIIALRNISHIGPDRYWPVGIYEFTKDLIQWGDRTLSMYFDSVMQNSAQWMAFNPDLVDEEDLIAQPGQRIPVEGGRFADALFPMKVGQPAPELFDLYNITKTAREERVGLFAYQKGQSPVRKETATASQLLSDAGGNRLEFGILQIEQTGLAEVAYVAAKEIDANATEGERGQILGYQESMMLGSADPDSLEGGYYWEFKGSDKIRRQTEKLEREIQGYNLVRNQPTIQSGWVMDRQLLKDMDTYTEEQLDQMGLTEEAQMQMREAEAAAEAAAAAAAAAGTPMEGGMEEGGPQSVGQDGAIANPNSIVTPAINQANKVAV